MKFIIREIIWYVIFLLVFFIISYGNRDLIMFKVMRYMSNIFEKVVYSGNLIYGKVCLRFVSFIINFIYMVVEWLMGV